ncbi:glutamate racemase [Christensenellaceae bacterium OttesenSCG-928-M15]|nr:glutamate racemase [Christensenellaceae bacterium OttesenSCG-928-M15]
MTFVEKFIGTASGAQSPIGVFDSGVGGTSVLKEMYTLMPCENYWYYGDGANAPYGTKAVEFVRERTLYCLSRMVKNGAKALVIACNTATAAAVTLSRETFDVPVISMEPEIKTPAVVRHKRALVMATPMTLQLERFKKLMRRFEGETDMVLLPCPGLSDLVEVGKIDAPETREYLSALLDDAIASPVDSIVLGCTHYPHIKPLIREILGYDVAIYDGGAGTARELRRRLAQMDMLNTSGMPGQILFENSMDGTAMTSLSRELFERYVPTVNIAHG